MAKIGLWPSGLVQLPNKYKTKFQCNTNMYKCDLKTKFWRMCSVQGKQTNTIFLQIYPGYGKQVQIWRTMIKKIKIWRDISAKRQNIVTVRTMITLKFGIIFLVRGNQMQLQIQSENTNTKFGQICPVQVLHSAPVSDKGAASNLRSVEN